MSFIHHCGIERIINLTVCANNTEPAPLHETQFELIAELYLIRLVRKPHSLICILYSLHRLLSIFEERRLNVTAKNKRKKSEGNSLYKLSELLSPTTLPIHIMQISR